MLLSKIDCLKGMVACVALLAVTACEKKQPGAVVWTVDNLEKIGGVPVSIYGGAPQLADDGAGGRAVRFDGKGDGLLLPSVPISGWEKFTVEVDFFPEEGGEFEQRFIHMEDTRGYPRALFEIRLNPDGSWYLDTFLASSGKDGERCAVIDPAKTHPAGRWYRATLVYDGNRMTNYVNGVKQGEGAVLFRPIAGGKTSLGVRQNKVYWFKGMIREIRFYPEVRSPSSGG